mmetsp:Transcript_40112/g.93612  ORF Transcript_40112/g.93612 Transcript_40112/m.93612 type:complete len:376 (-) Transcript_40112:52-1179(-)
MVVTKRKSNFLFLAAVATADTMRIAIQGSGVAAAACAQRLQAKHAVTVFESGRGPGGRMSTRRAREFQWDHGAQYFSPKSEPFARVVDDWVARRWCAAWTGAHCVWSVESGVSEDPKAASARYVGSPGMNAICKGLLEGEGIDTRYETRAVAKPRGGGSGGWILQHAKSGRALGEFDFLVCSDKTAAMQHRKDLDRTVLADFVRPASAVPSVPSLALMVAMQATHLRFDSLLLNEHPTFSWLARDSSKPGRSRADGVECWVAHASPDCAKRLLSGGGRPSAIREAVVHELVPPFQALVSELSDAVGPPPKVLLAQGHRWGAAFPTACLDSCGSGRSQFYLDEPNRFAACGDFFSPYPGRVEGGWISGTSLADALL